MSSIWQLDAPWRPRPPLARSISCDTAIIGGGLAGILTAALLSAEGNRVVVLEADRIGSGQTSRTTAKVTSQHGAVYHKLEHSLGLSAAGQYADANQRAIAAYRQLIRTKKIRCCWEDTDACLYSTEDEEKLILEAEAQRRAGLPSVFSRDSSLPFPVRGVVRLGAQGQFHPLRFLFALTEELPVYEKSRVLSVDGNHLETTGGSVRAENIIFACHYPFVNWPGGYFMRMHQERSYVLALKGAPQLSDHFYCVDRGGLSLRQAGEYLLIGGGSHRTGENKSAGQYDALRRSAALLFPGSQEAACWSAQDCVTLDSVPYIGQFSAFTPNWHVATGFGKWGMSSAMVAALLLRDILHGREAGWGKIFSPQRIDPRASAVSLANEGAHAIKGLGQQLFAEAGSYAEILPPGHGGIAVLKGEKVGIYKSPSGEVWLVSVRCPHLGCELTWNAEEKSWDCPCHGSRFDYKGQSLDGPAQENLAAWRLETL